MNTLIAIFFTVLLVACGVAFFIAYQNYKVWKYNKAIAKELDLLVQNTLETVQKNKKIATKKSRDISLDDLYSMRDPQMDDITSPEMLTSILTVIVHKYKNIRLHLKDFMIPEEEYISVYVDTNSQELILSKNHDMSDPADPYSMVNFAKSDDNTFH
jgi:hypothetical protein